MIKYFKPNLTDKKSKIFFGIKIVVALYYVYLMVNFFVQKYYVNWRIVNNKSIATPDPGRIALILIFGVLGILVLFLNVNLTKKQNTIFTLVLSALSIVLVFYNTQISVIVGTMQEFFNYLFKMRIIYLVFNLFILATLFLILYVLTNSFKVSIISMTVISYIICLVNYFVTEFRGTAFIAVDFTTTDTGLSVAGGYEYKFVFRMILCTMITIMIIALALKLDKNPIKFWWLRIAALLMAIVFILIGYTKIWDSNHYDKLIKMKYYRPQRTYMLKGFYISFLKSIKDTQVKEPQGYSVKVVKDLSKKYPGTKAKTKDTPNIIVVMDEAFTDYSSLCDLKINKDNVPFLHSLKENTISGRLFVPVFGGGTVSTEFESLTSNTMAFEPYGVTSYTTFIDRPMQSLASNLKSQGIGKAEALHPFIKKDYKRDKVYNYFGFDRFYGIKDFGPDPEICGTFISDNEDADKLIQKYENYRKESNKPYFMFNVTMQNHSPFLSGKDLGDYKLEYPGDLKEANEYMNLISHSDAAAKKIINYFKKVDEKTIVLFFGDHQPKVEDLFFSQVDKTFKIKNIPHSQRKRISSYYLWANYDIEEKQNYDISSNFLEELVLENAGLGMSGYQQMANDIMKDVPVISTYGCIDKNGKWFKAKDKKSKYYKRLNDYHIAQYNDLHDVEHRVDKFFAVK